MIPEVDVYLPGYLSNDTHDQTLRELAQHPKTERFYSRLSEYGSKILQGDGIPNLPVINLPDTKVGSAKVLILSNTCDIDLDNDRKRFGAMVLYAPIMKLSAYIGALERSGDTGISEHVQHIKGQRITQILYLPEIGDLEECIVFLDRINHCKNADVSRERLEERKLFSLNQYGHYLLLFKLSMHFTRIHEGVDREFEDA